MKVSYSDLKPLNSLGKCPSSFTKCDGDGKISKAKKICIPSTEFQTGGCPITDLKFVKKSV